MLRKSLRGFTLLELMVVISILAILMLVSLPSYMDKMVRDQVAEGLPLADIAKPAIQLAWSTGADLPADNAAAGLPPPEKIVNTRVKSVTVQNGAIHIRFGNQAHRLLQDKVLTVRPAGVTDARIVPLAWLCGAAHAPQPMTPQGDDRTSIASGLLPVRCR